MKAENKAYGEMKQLVLIPSSRYVDPEMQLEVGKIPPVMISLNGRSVLEMIIDEWKQKLSNPEFFIITCEGHENLRRHLEFKELTAPVHLIPIGVKSELGEAILDGLNQINLKEFDRMVLNFGDTIVQHDCPLDTDCISFSYLNESFRWTSFETTDGKITTITPKAHCHSTERQKIFTGMFHITAPEQFAQSLAHNNGLFYEGLLEYLASRPYRVDEAQAWHDFGHADNYQLAKKHTINRRYFNQIEIDTKRSILSKKSSNVEKFIGEISWYLELPTELKCYIPQVYEYSLNPENPGIKMEYYGYPSLADLFVCGGYDAGIWNHVLNSVFLVLDEMRRFTLPLKQAEFDGAIHEMYVTKTLKRLSDARAFPFLADYMDRSLVINGVHSQPLNTYLQNLPKLVTDIWSTRNPTLSVLHGDLCLSNILFDPKGRIVKLIDPRGQFGKYSIYGDPIYDLAKLIHSFEGLYELIITDNFFITVEDSEIHYTFNTTPAQLDIQTLFKARLEFHYPTDAYAARFVEALLFLSMIPLHKDKPNRQLMMYLLGLEKISHFLEVRDEHRCSI